MITDALALLSDAQALTATAISTNVIDLGNPTPKNDIGIGEEMTIVFTVDVAADFTTGDETYQFDFNQSAAAALSSPTTLVRRIIAAGLLTLGSIHHLKIPKSAITQRYVGVNYTLGGTTPTLTITAFLQPSNMAEARATYAKGYTIS